MHDVIKFQWVGSRISMEQLFSFTCPSKLGPSVGAANSVAHLSEREKMKRKIRSVGGGNLVGGGKKSCPLCGTNPGAGEQVCPTKGNLAEIKEEASPKKERNKGFVLLKCLRRLLMRGALMQRTKRNTRRTYRKYEKYEKYEKWRKLKSS